MDDEGHEEGNFSVLKNDVDNLQPGSTGTTGGEEDMDLYSSYINAVDLVMEYV